MIRIAAAAFCLLAASFLIPAWAVATCQYAHVVDPCTKRVFVLDAGEFDATCFVDLGEGPAGAYEPRAVDHSTFSWHAAFDSFVSQGPFLRVVRAGSIYVCEYDPDEGLQPTVTLDLAADLGLSGIELAGLHAGGPVQLGGETRYPLYAAATLRGATDQPWLVIFDQEPLVRVPPDPASALWAAFPLCPGGTACEGEAIDVAAGAQLPDGSRELFVSVLAADGAQPVQRFLRVVLLESGAGDVVLDSWNDEWVPFEGGEPGALGLDYDGQGLAAHGVFQTSAVVADLHDGLRTCELGPGDPTDVAVWGPGAELDNPWVQFVSTSNGTEAGIVFGYPEGVCPIVGQSPAGSDPDAAARQGVDGHAWIIDTGDPDEAGLLVVDLDSNLPGGMYADDLSQLEIAPGALGLAVGARPQALALSSRTDWRPWIYVANGAGGVSAIHVEIRHDPTDGDMMELLEQLEIPLGECPSAVSFRDDEHTECIRWVLQDGFDVPSAPRPGECPPGDLDPWCL